MMSRTRVAGGMDVQRLAAALRGPGVDTRCWVSLAVAAGDSHVDRTEGKEGVFVDVELMPTEEPLTARIGPVYAGTGFGIYARVHKDDELVVLIPSGTPAEGAVVVARLWSAADVPPEEAQQNPEDLIIVVEEEHSLRIKIRKGGGKVFIDVEGDEGEVTNQLVVDKDLIELGAEGAQDQAVLESKNQNELARVQSDLNTQADESGRVRDPLPKYFMPLLFNPEPQYVIKAPLIYGPTGAIDIQTGQATKPNNAPVDFTTQPGEFIPSADPQKSGLFTPGSDPSSTNSERVTIDK